MASNSTQNFHLNQWTLDDDVRMEDFNADNAKLETALSGMLQCATGSYTGTGEYGAEHPNTLTFDFTPMLVIVTGRDVANYVCTQTTFTRGSDIASIVTRYGNNFAGTFTSPTWGARSVSWSGLDAYTQSNYENVVYHYLVIGCAATPA